MDWVSYLLDVGIILAWLNETDWDHTLHTGASYARASVSTWIRRWQGISTPAAMQDITVGKGQTTPRWNTLSSIKVGTFGTGGQAELPMREDHSV